MSVTIDVLGPLRASAETNIELTRPSHRRLLSIFALEFGKRISSDSLIDRFWGESPPPAAKAALQTHVSALRRLLGESTIVTEAHGYRLDITPDNLDASRYMTLADLARRSAQEKTWQETLDHIDAAEGLWRGLPYLDIRDDDFARSSTTRIEETRSDLLELRAEARLALGQHRDAVAELEGLVIEYPLRERFWEHLMTARLRSGRPTEALRAFQEVTELLAEAGLEPGERLRRLEERILLYGERTPEKRTNLPNPISEFVGRVGETDLLRETMMANRLTTVTGAGGSGKTRIAIEMSRREEKSFADGIWLIELASIEDGGIVVAELTRALDLHPDGADPLQHASEFLVDKSALLIFDNVEHLLDAVVPVVRTILEAAPDVRALATGREPLRIPGEAIFDLEGMAVPQPGTAVEEASSIDAIRLFVERAKLVRPRFQVTNSNLEPIIEICSQLDGMPLAIELAAARTRSLEPKVIADRLDDRFELLRAEASHGHPKQRTLEATIEWSYQLLSAAEKVLLENLSVFRGGFDHEMAESVGFTDPAKHKDILPSLSDLIDKSLVTTYESNSGIRFRFLESVRVFAETRLRNSERANPVDEAMLAWARQFSDTVIVDRIGPRTSQLGKRLLNDLENLSRAAELARRRKELESAVRISSAIASYWQIAGYPSRAATVLRAALTTTDMEDETAAYLHAFLADLVKFTADDDSVEHAVIAFDLSKNLDPSPTTALALRHLSLLYLLRVEEDSALSVRLARDAVAAGVTSDDPYAELWSRRVLAKTLAWNGDHDEAHAELQKCAKIGREALPGTAFEGFGHSHQVLYADPSRRRDEPIVAMRDIEKRFSDTLLNWEAIRNHGIDEAMTWRTWAHCQVGDFDAASEASALYSSEYREGFSATGQVIAEALVSWMRGDLSASWNTLTSVETEVSSRWFHDYFPLLADVAADLEDLVVVKQTADRWMSEQVHASEESMKLAVLNPLVRALVHASLLADAEDAAVHSKEAQRVVEEMALILEQFPPLNDGSFSMETPRTHLAIATAELTRLGEGSDPLAWQFAMDSADFIYSRLYCHLRLAESLSQSGRAKEAATELATAVSRSSEIGAKHLTKLGEEIERSFAI